MIEIKLVGIEKLEMLIRSALSLRKKVRDGILLECRYFGQMVVDRSKKAYLSGRPGLNVVTGRLRASIVSQVKPEDDSVMVQVGTNVLYAPQHEFGDPARHIPQRAFIHPAVEDELPAFVKRMGNSLGQIMKASLSGQ